MRWLPRSWLRVASLLTIGAVCASGCDLDLSKRWPFRKAKRKRTRTSATAAPPRPPAPVVPRPAPSASVAPSAPAPSATAPILCSPPPAASGARPAGARDADASEQKFAFSDEEYLLKHQRDGGLVYVPSAVPAGASAPLIIFLHGTNANGPLHRGLGSGAAVLTSPNEIEAGYDLRPVVQELIDSGAMEPALVSGPSQTREAARGHDLWPAFDPDAFASAVEQSLHGRARVARDRILVVGHSGAGCNPDDGGLVGVARRVARAAPPNPPRALLAIDTCLDDWVADALRSAAPTSPVWVYFQTATWDRPFDAFSDRFLPDEDANDDSRHVVEIEGLSGDAAHNLVLPRALRLALPALLPPRTCP